MAIILPCTCDIFTWAMLARKRLSCAHPHSWSYNMVAMHACMGPEYQGPCKTHLLQVRVVQGQGFQAKVQREEEAEPRHKGGRAEGTGGHIQPPCAPPWHPLLLQPSLPVDPVVMGLMLHVRPRLCSRTQVWGPLLHIQSC